MKSLAELIKEARRKKAGVPTDELLEAHNAWQRVAGPLGRFTRASKCCRGTLVIVAASSAIIQEYRFNERNLLSSIQRELPERHIRNLRFQTGRV